MTSFIYFWFYWVAMLSSIGAMIVYRKDTEKFATYLIIFLLSFIGQSSNWYEWYRVFSILVGFDWKAE